MLIGNGSVLQKSPTRFIAGSSTSVESQLRSNFSKTGMMRGRMYVDMSTAALPLYAVPEGNYAGSAWMLPEKSGSAASHSATFVTLSASATGAMGITATSSVSASITANGTIWPLDDSSPIRTADTTFTISTGTCSGGLIANGIGSADVYITTNTPSLTSPLGGVGESTLTVTTNEPLLEALASVIASGDISFSSSATALPADDTSPSRTAGATITFSASAFAFPSDDTSPSRTASAAFSTSGTLTAYALGNMVGSALPYTELSPQSLANAVWDEDALMHAIDGTMGKLMSSAGTGGVDYELLAAAVISAARLSPIYSDVRRVNDSVIVGSGVDGDEWGVA